MNSDGEVQVIVSTKRVPAYTVESTRPVYVPTPIGSFSTSWKEYAVVYETVLPDNDKAAIQEAQKISNSLGLSLEVVDRAKVSVLRRFFSSLGRPHPGPRIIVSTPSRWNRGRAPRDPDSTGVQHEPSPSGCELVVQPT